VAAGSYYDGTSEGKESGWYQLYSDTLTPYPAPAALLEHCAPPKPRESIAKIGTRDFGDAKKLYKWMAEMKPFNRMKIGAMPAWLRNSNSATPA